MTEQDFSDRLKKLQDKTSEYRGRIIDATIHVEGLIESTLAEYFCNDAKKKNYLISLLISNSVTNLLTKEKTLTILITNEYPEFLKNHNSLLKEIQEIRGMRNDLAHSKVNSDTKDIESFDGNAIELFYLKDGKEKTKKIDLEILNEHIKKINRTLTALVELNQIVIKENLKK